MPSSYELGYSWAHVWRLTMYKDSMNIIELIDSLHILDLEFKKGVCDSFGDSGDWDCCRIIIDNYLS